MKVSCRDDQVLFGKNRGIIGYGIDFVPEHISHIIDGILGGSVNLGDASERIGILYMDLGPVD